MDMQPPGLGRHYDLLQAQCWKLERYKHTCSIRSGPMTQHLDVMPPRRSCMRAGHPDGQRPHSSTSTLHYCTAATLSNLALSQRVQIVLYCHGNHGEAGRGAAYLGGREVG